MAQRKRHGIKRALRWYSSPYNILSTFSLDICIGVIGTGYLAHYCTNSTMSMHWWISLVFACWAIYSSEHLADGKRMGANAIHLRHKIHAIYSRPIALLVTLSIGSIITLLVYLHDTRLLGFGTVMGIACVAYIALITSKKLRCLKEALITLLYTAGVWGYPILKNPETLHSSLPIATCFCLLGYLNLMMTAQYEYQSDLHDNTKTIATELGLPRLRIWFWICATVFLIGNLNYITYPAAKLLLVMGLLTISLFTSYPKLQHHYRYRILGEAIFWLPLLIPLIQKIS